MQRLARACLVIPSTYPTALALIAHYERKRTQKPCGAFLHLDDSSRRDSQPERSCGLATSRSPTVDVRGLAVLHTAVAVASGHHTGGSPGGSPGGSLGGSPGDSPGGSPGDSPGGIPGDSLGGSPVGSRGVKRSPPGSPVPSSPSSSSSRRTPRVQAKLTVTIADGEAAAKFRAAGTAGPKWLSTFIYDRWGCCTGDLEYRKLTHRVRNSISKYELEATTGDVLQKPGKGIRHGGHRCRVVNPKERVRLASRTRQGKNTKMPEMCHELYQWWVDLAQVKHARVPTPMIMAEAQLMIDDARRHAEETRAEGREPLAFRVPVISFTWISRWRRFYSIVPRCITCSYKVSYAKKLRRLGVLWRNATRLLVFHELLFGPDKLTFVSMDEKPYRFNACGGDKVWGLRGQKSVKCKELRAMLLNRWTGITAVFSRKHSSACLPDGTWQPKWTALFRAKTGERCDVTSPSARCQVLYAEHGSVTSPTWLQYLAHILPRVDNPAHAVVPVTDWYGPHLMEGAVQYAMDRTKSPTLFIGGGTTGEAAVCDKTPHRVMSLRYREAEMCAHTNSLKYRPGQVPRWTKQNVLDRGWQTWQGFDHKCGDELHKTHGFTNPVDGTEDGALDSSTSLLAHARNARCATEDQEAGVVYSMERCSVPPRVA